MIGKRTKYQSFKGIVLERKVKNQLIAEGYLAIRSPRSLGLFDIWAMNKEHIRLIQLKYNAISKVETERIRAFDNLPNNAIKEIWIYKNGSFEKIVIAQNSFNDLTELFSEYCAKVLQEKSADTHKACLKRIKDFACKEGIDPLTITKDQIREFLSELYEKGLTANYVYQITHSLRKFYDFLVKYEIIKENAFNSISNPKTLQKLPKIISEVEMNRLLDSVKDPLCAALLETLYATGVTTSELTGLNYEDIDFKGEMIKVCDTDGRERRVPITKKAIAKIKAYRDLIVKKHTRPVFVGDRGRRLSKSLLYHILNSRTADSGLTEKVSPRLIRASLIVHLLERGMDPISIKHMMGFESLEGVTEYFSLMMKDKKEAIDRLLPRGPQDEITPENIINSPLGRAGNLSKEDFIPKKIRCR